MSTNLEIRPELERVTAIEEAFVNHWSIFGRWPKAKLHDDDGVLWFESPLTHLPYNAVIRTLLSDDEAADRKIQEILEAFRSRKVDFMWVRRPGDTPDSLGAKLQREGLNLVEHVTGMDLDLFGWEPSPRSSAARLTIVGSEQELLDYEALVGNYWSIPQREQELISEVHHYYGLGPRDPGLRIVAYQSDEPVGKLFMNLTELPHRASIYGVSVLPKARGAGLATSMMEYAMELAREKGAGRIVIHSSPSAKSLYTRMGFQERCVFEVYATAELFEATHQN